MTDYMKITTELPPYFFFPWFLMDMAYRQADLYPFA